MIDLLVICFFKINLASINNSNHVEAFLYITTHSYLPPPVLADLHRTPAGGKGILVS